MHVRTASDPLVQSLSAPLVYIRRHVRAFAGGLVTTLGLCIAAVTWHQPGIALVTGAAAVAYLAVDDSAFRRIVTVTQWFRPFTRGVGFGCLLVFITGMVRPYDSGRGGLWLLLLTAGFATFWAVGPRRGHIEFFTAAATSLLFFLASPIVQQAVVGRTFSRWLQAIDPSTTRLILFAFAYVVIAWLFDARAWQGGASMVLFAATLALLWAAFAVDLSDRTNLLAGLLVAIAVIAMTWRTNRNITFSLVLAVLVANGLRTFYEFDLDFSFPSIAWTLPIGLFMVVLGLVIAAA
jgi:hypothetical protein